MGLSDEPGTGVDAGQYCREVEAHLCRKNDGHLIRIVGPAFEMVAGWAEQGIPLRVAFEGIDRFVARYYRKGPRRRPVHISFCEADVLDVFEAWRRAVGVPAGEAAGSDNAARGPRRTGLGPHLERAIAALTALRGGAAPGLDAALAGAVRALDRLRAPGAAPRGDARARVLEELRRIDDRLMNDVRSALAPDERSALERDADVSLAPFRQRMSEAEWVRARSAAFDRSIRVLFRLPTLSIE